MRPNSPPQITSVSSSKPRCFRSLQQRRGRLIGAAAHAACGCLRGRSGRPTGCRRRSRPARSARRVRPAAARAGSGGRTRRSPCGCRPYASFVLSASCDRSTASGAVACMRNASSYAVCRASSCVSPGRSRRWMSFSFADEVELRLLAVGADFRGRVQVEDRVGAVAEQRALVGGGHVAGAPVARAADRLRAAVRRARRTRAGSGSRCRGRRCAHEPRLGRPARIEPVFIWQTLPTWFSPSAQQARSTAKSSAHVAMCGSQSLKSIPHWPCLANFRLLASRLLPPVPIGVMTLPKLAGSGLPCCRVSSGFGSKRSTWLGPPSMNRKMTDLAFAGNCGFFGASGSTARAASEAATLPRPVPPGPERRSRCRRSEGTHGGRKGAERA